MGKIEGADTDHRVLNVMGSREEGEEWVVTVATEGSGFGKTTY